MHNSFKIIMAATVLFATGIDLVAQEENSQQWNGKWIANGTLFQIEVSVENSVIKVIQIESLGFEWTSKEGKVDGNIAQVEVEYAGVILPHRSRVDRGRLGNRSGFPPVLRAPRSGSRSR